MRVERSSTVLDNLVAGWLTPCRSWQYQNQHCLCRMNRQTLVWLHPQTAHQHGHSKDGLPLPTRAVYPPRNCPRHCIEKNSPPAMQHTLPTRRDRLHLYQQPQPGRPKQYLVKGGRAGCVHHSYRDSAHAYRSPSSLRCDDEKLLHRADIVASVQEVCGERMPE